MTITRKTATAALVTLVLGAGGVALTAPASAYSFDYLHNGVRIRSAPYLNADIYGHGYPGQGADRLGLTQGQRYPYNNMWGSGTSALWALNRNLVTGVEGWSGSFLLS